MSPPHILLFPLPPSPTNVAIVPIITNHLFPLVGNTGAYGRQPLKGIELTDTAMKSAKIEALENL
jgi:hypothetical protein